MDPSDDEGIPAYSQEVALNLLAFLPFPVQPDPLRTAQYVKRPGETLESGSTQESPTEREKQQQDVKMVSAMEPRAECEKHQDADMEEYGIFPSNDDNIQLALAPEDVQNATYLPAAGWPP